MMRNPWIWIAGAALVTVMTLVFPAGLSAQSDMPTVEEVRDALDTLRRFERALAAQSPSSVEETHQPPPGGFRSPLSTPTLGALSPQPPSPQMVVAPSTFSLNLDGDLELAGFVFQDGTPFLHNDGDTNTALGLNALISATPGYPSGASGSFNSAFGYEALRFNTEGFGNTASGRRSLYANTMGYRNTATGERALQNNLTGALNTATGVRSLQSNTEGCCNTANGYSALLSNTTGYDNTASGYKALADNTSGHSNAAFGDSALSANTMGFSNTAVGTGAAEAITTGSFNTAIGINAGALWTTGFNNIAIGPGAYGSAGEADTIRIGGSSFSQTFIGGITGANVGTASSVYVNASGQLGTSTSSARFKQDIHDLEGVSDRLQDLRPVSFRYKDELAKGGPNPTQYGLIAEEVAEIFPELVAYDDNGEPYTVRYHLLTPLLLGEVLRLESERERSEGEVEDLRRQVGDQRKVVAHLTRRLEELERKR